MLIGGCFVGSHLRAKRAEPWRQQQLMSYERRELAREHGVSVGEVTGDHKTYFFLMRPLVSWPAGQQLPENTCFRSLLFAHLFCDPAAVLLADLDRGPSRR